MSTFGRWLLTHKIESVAVINRVSISVYLSVTYARFQYLHFNEITFVSIRRITLLCSLTAFRFASNRTPDTTFGNSFLHGAVVFI